MELKEGCRYFRRNGTITPPLYTLNEYLHDKDSGFDYDPNDPLDGHYVYSNGDTSECDLMVEVSIPFVFVERELDESEN